MNLDVDRLAQLAGLPVSTKRNLNEASNRSMHDDPSVSDEKDHRFGKNQLSERGSKKGDQSATHSDYEKNEGGAKKGDQSATHSDFEEALSLPDEKIMGEEDEVVDINEAMLAKEIKRMRRERLQENELRGIIRAEIGSIIKDLKKESSRGSSRSRSRANKMRQVTMGIPGPGFR